MFVQIIASGSTNTVIEYDGNDYLFFSDRTAGKTFYLNGVDITSSVINISSGAFSTQVVVQGDQTEYIVDDEKNTYFKVLQYTTITTTRPTRS